ncbi:MAG: replication-relaxation family protein [Acidimicrobiales bacterium]
MTPHINQPVAGGNVQAPLAKRDRRIITSLGELRLLSARQVERLHFPTEDYANELSARRMARRTLDRLARERLVVRLQRRIGGVTAGSAGYVYGVGPEALRRLDDEHVRRHYREPSSAFVEHTLAVAEVAVDITVAARSGQFELLELAGEPRCWRPLAGLSGRQVLRPDLFVGLGIGEWEDRRFVEVDLGTEHLPTVVKKCQDYLAYYKSGREQARHGVFPTVVWAVQTERRAATLTEAIGSLRSGVDGLFTVVMADTAADHLAGGDA